MLVPALAGLAVEEYAPNAIKKAVVGVGHASKQQIEYMVKLQLPKIQLKSIDSTDAMAVAICHANHLRNSMKMQKKNSVLYLIMIGRISGKLNYVSADHILVDVSGVGYILHVTQTTLTNLPKLGNTVSLFTELVVKEDLLQLVGFITVTEKEWYKLLISVQGVGSKAALALLSQLPISSISRAILLEDTTTITSVQGIGPKIAKRLVVELKSKVPSMMKFNDEYDLASNNLNSALGLSLIHI